MNFAETMWAVQWDNPDTGNWEVCQTFDHQEKEAFTIFPTQALACQELLEWLVSSDETDEYRVAQINITTKE
jgi:hypothetical protein